MPKKELPSIRDQVRSLRLLRIVFLFNKVLRCMGLGSRTLAAQEGEFLSLQSRLHEFKTIPAQFNAHFSSRGWIAHDSMNFELMKDAVQKADTEGVDKAEESLFHDYRPEALQPRLVRLTATAQVRRRYRFIEFAFNDYAEGRYYSTVPLLLMVIDGSVNEVLGTGLHAENAYMEVWDAVTAIDGGIENIKAIFKKGRFKTTDEQIDLPYRNGILHGLDLGYDNHNVAAKCWHFLFVTHDWILSKQSEDNRFARYQKDKNPPRFRDILRHVSEIQEEKHAIDTWRPRHITKDYLNNVASNVSNDKLIPEVVLIAFLELWKKRNYGHMANLYWLPLSNHKPDIMGVKQQFRDKTIGAYRITNIVDDAPAITNIGVEIIIGGVPSSFEARLLFAGSNDNKPHCRNSCDGEWKLVHVRQQ